MFLGEWDATAAAERCGPRRGETGGRMAAVVGRGSWCFQSEFCVSGSGFLLVTERGLIPKFNVPTRGSAQFVGGNFH